MKDKLDKIITARISQDEFENLSMLTDLINEVGIDVIKSRKAREILKELQSHKERKQITVTVGDLLRLGIHLTLDDMEEILLDVRKSKEEYKRNLKRI